MKKRPIVLCIMDGYGISERIDGNAVKLANTPNLDDLMAIYPTTTIKASGMPVGLPDGQMGNSEVGHLNIGAGRTVYQSLTLINKAVADGSFYQNEEFLKAIKNAKDNNTKLHIWGLLSNGGVHSSNEHIYALLKLAKQEGLEKVYVHAFLDGRDVAPDSGVDFVQELVDKIMLDLDGTSDKRILGANAILGVSLANLKAAALYSGKELYEYIGNGNMMPKCMMNILNGGAHAENGLDIQEFMIVPYKKEYKDNLRMGAEVFHSLKKILKDKGLSCGVGDEGGFAPDISNTYEALDLIKLAISDAGYNLGSDIYIALDVAASEFYNDGYYEFEGKKLSKEEMLAFYEKLITDYPIISIEDGMAEEDFEGWKLLTNSLGNKIQLVGDDLFVTNKKLLQKGIDMGIANAILLKLNQIGTVTETLDTIKLAKENNYKTIISHRSGETEDNYIADFAVALNLGQIKTGSLSRSERISKYNRLTRIEEKVR